MDCQYYHDNTMFIEIYFEALNYEVLTESEAYTVRLVSGRSTWELMT